MDWQLVAGGVLVIVGLVGMVLGLTYGLTYMVSHQTRGQYITCPSGYSVMMQRMPNGHLDVSCG